MRYPPLLNKYITIQLNLQFTDFPFIGIFFILGAVFIERQDLVDNDLGFVGVVDYDVDEGFGFKDALDDPAVDRAAIDAGGEDESEDEDSHREREQLD